MLDGERLTHCGMYHHRAGMPRNRGNSFQVAPEASTATCMTCRQAVGLPKTVAYYYSAMAEPPIAVGPMSIFPDVEMRSLSGWVPYIQGPVAMTEPMTEPEMKERLRITLAWCSGYHLLILVHAVGLQAIRIGVLRRLQLTFVCDEYPSYKPEWAVERPTPPQPRTRWERLLDD